MNIDSTLLKEHITPDKMIDLMNELGATYTEDNGDKGIIFDTICHNHSGQGSPKLYYYPEGQTFHCYTGCSHSFDIYELVSKVYKLRNVELHFSSIIDFVATKTGYQPPMGFGSAFQLPVEKETTGDLEWLNKVTARKKRAIPELPKYHKELLEVFSTWHHPMFLEDGISITTMDKYQIKFYEKEERIVIPYFDHKSGMLVGLRGRTIKESEELAGRKYLPITVQGKMYNFPTHSGTMFGLHHNAEKIRKCKKIAIFESEKSVMQCDTFYGDDNFTVALSGKSIPLNILDILFDLDVEEVMLCYDRMYEKIDEEDRGWNEFCELVKRATKVLAPYFRVYVVYDRIGEFLEKDESPSDRGKEVLQSLMLCKQEVYTRSV